MNNRQPVDLDELNLKKLKLNKLNKSRKLIREIFANLLFLCVLFITAFTNIDGNTYFYKEQTRKTFSTNTNVLFIFCLFF